MKKQFSVAIIGCGSRGALFAELMLKMDGAYKISALCDICAEQIEKTKDLLSLRDTEDFTDVEGFFEKKRADVLVIASHDREHVPQALRALELGYDILLEKPISDSREELSALLEAQKKSGRTVIVCHELRYGKAYMKCEEILRSGILGRLYMIDASERPVYWHWAQSYVRGICASLELGFPAILAKCSHDLDLVQNFAGSECESVSSVGGLDFFKPENAPEGAADRCLDCKHVDTCPYSAKRIYIDMWHAAGEPEFIWPYNKVTLEIPNTERALTEGIRTGEYGRCAFKCPVEKVDNQMVQMTFKNGVKASLKMAYASEVGRRIVFYCTLGELVFDDRSRSIEVRRFGEPVEVIDTRKLTNGSGVGHGGGDKEIIRELYEILCGEKQPATSLRESIECHLMGIAAEESRALGGALVSVHL